MSDQRAKHENPTKRDELKKPFMLAYTVKPIDDGRNAVWSKIGAAWAHKDGQGYEVRMDALPLDGRVVLRTIRERDEDASGEVIDREPS